MKNQIIFKILILCVCFAIALSAQGCKPNTDDETNSSSSETTPTEENPSSNEEYTEEPEEEPPYEENTDWDDDLEDGEYEDVYYEEEEYYFEETVRVNNASSPVQSDFLGFNTVQHCFTYIKDDYGRNYTEAQAQLEFNRLQNMGVKIVRTYYNEEYAFDAEKGEFNWESEDMKAVYKWMLEMQKRDIAIACNTGWAIDGAYKENYWVAWKGAYVDGDIDATIKNHTNWMAESLKQFRAHGINNIDYLIMFTEPGGSGTEIDTEKLANTYLEDAYELDPQVDLWLKASRSIHDALVKDGTRALYKTVGPNTHNNFSSKLRLATNSFP